MDVVRIFLGIILPIFILIGVGVFLDRFRELDLPTFSALNFYVFVPALIFIKVLESEIQPRLMFGVGLFAFVHVFLLLGVSTALFSFGPLRRKRTVLSLGTMFFNAGNFGIPLTVLAFGEDMVSVLAVVLLVQNFLSFTLGLWLLEREHRLSGSILQRLLRIPVIHAIVLGLVLKGLDLQLVEQVRVPLNYLADGLIPIALLTLGVQLSRSRIGRNLVPLGAVGMARLVLSPMLAFGLVLLFGFEPPVSSLLIVAAALPVAVNTFILSAEYGRDADLASQAVFWTTLMSAVTLPLLLCFLGIS